MASSPLWQLFVCALAAQQPDADHSSHHSATSISPAAIPVSPTMPPAESNSTRSNRRRGRPPVNAHIALAPARPYTLPRPGKAEPRTAAKANYQHSATDRHKRNEAVRRSRAAKEERETRERQRLTEEVGRI